MRKLLATAALGVAVAATGLPVSSASAYCDPLLYALTGDCTNSCKITWQAYDAADHALRDRLPEAPADCPQ